MFVDSHCHLDRLDLTVYETGLDGAIAAARARQVNSMLCVGINLANAGRVVEIAESYDQIYASVGIHPMDVENLDPSDDPWTVLRGLAASDKVVAIGESGLDYFYSKDSADEQKQSFRRHLQLAGELEKPIIVHTRGAQQDTLSLIAEYGNSEQGGVLHCFTEGWEMACEAIEMNYFISFSGILTFKNADALRQVAKKVPLERLLIETDSPYLAPVPFRGKSNEPQYVVEVAQCLAQLHGVSLQEIAAITRANFERLFLAGSSSSSASLG